MTNSAWKYFGISTPAVYLWGIKSTQESTLTRLFVRSLLRWFFGEICFAIGGGLEPSWRGRAIRCRAPTSTASPCPPTPTSSPTCWGACRLRPCQDCPSAGTARPRQPVSKLYVSAIFVYSVLAPIWDRAMLWLLCRLVLE